MKEVFAEGTKFMYFAKNELPPEEVNGKKVTGYEYKINDFMKAKLLTSSDIRLVLFPLKHENLPEGEIYLLYYLYWTNTVDLDLLDEKVRTDTYADTDFEAAIRTEAQITFCPVCGWKGHTLKFPLADLYQDALDLYDKKENMAFNHFVRCPNCGSGLRQPIVKILSK